MRASLIIAAHNESDRLWRTVASCVETSAGLDCEIVIADDASWDESVEETLRRFPQVRVVRHEERKGASPTKDLGARHARGDTLIFLDGHTKPEPGAIQRLIEDVERLKGEAIITPAVTGLCVTRWKSSDHQKGHGYSLELERLDCAWLPLDALRPHPHRGRLFYESPALIGCAFAVHRELYDDLRGFDPHMLCWGVEDLDFGLKCWLMGHPILHDPEAVIGHRFQPRFDNFEVPIERLLVNQLRMARKNFTEAVWSDWIERCRRRYPGKLSGHPEGLWARAWDLFGELRASVEQERAYLLARRVHDEFWFAERFDLPWPRLQTDAAAPIPTATREFSAASEPEPSPQPTDSTHYLDAVDDSFGVADINLSGQVTGNVIIDDDADDDDGTDTYDGIPIANTTGFIATLLTPPQHGSVTVEPNGHFTYSRDLGYTGSDSFTYELRGPNNELDQATVNIHGLGINDHEPEFTGDHTATFREDTALNTILLTVAATDQDGGTLTHSIIGGNDDGIFGIGETDGVIRLVKKLDYETAQRHTLTVKAMDTTGLSATTNAVINVTDVGEPPVVPAEIYTVDDGAEVDTLVGSITATDPEDEPIGYYTIVEQKGIDGGGIEHPLGVPFFRIEKLPDSDMALIYVADGVTIDYNVYHSFRLNIQAYVIGFQFGNEWSTINVAYNDALLEAIDDNFSLSELPQNEYGAYIANVLTNDLLGGSPYVPDSSTQVTVDEGREPQHGTVTLFSDGTCEYTPESEESGDDQFGYLVADISTSQTSSALVSLILAAAPDKPVVGMVLDNVAMEGDDDHFQIRFTRFDETEVDGHIIGTPRTDGALTIRFETRFIAPPGVAAATLADLKDNAARTTLTSGVVVIPDGESELVLDFYAAEDDPSPATRTDTRREQFHVRLHTNRFYTVVDNDGVLVDQIAQRSAYNESWFSIYEGVVIACQPNGVPGPEKKYWWNDYRQSYYDCYFASALVAAIRANPDRPGFSIMEFITNGIGNGTFRVTFGNGEIAIVNDNNLDRGPDQFNLEMADVDHVGRVEIWSVLLERALAVLSAQAEHQAIPEYWKGVRGGTAVDAYQLITGRMATPTDLYDDPPRIPLSRAARIAIIRTAIVNQRKQVMLSSQDWQPGWRKPDDWFSFQHVYVVTAITDIDITIIDPYNMQLGQRTRPLGVWFDTYMARITIGN